MPKLELNLGIKSSFPEKNGGLPAVFVFYSFFKIFKFSVNFEKKNGG
jgi:hypothetical protein